MPRQMILLPRFFGEVHVVCVHESKFKMNIGKLLFDATLTKIIAEPTVLSVAAVRVLLARRKNLSK